MERWEEIACEFSNKGLTYDYSLQEYGDSSCGYELDQVLATTDVAREYFLALRELKDRRREAKRAYLLDTIREIEEQIGDGRQGMIDPDRKSPSLWDATERASDRR